MHRREFLAAVGAGALGAGCLDGATQETGDGTDGNATTGDSTATPATTMPATSATGTGTVEPTPTSTPDIDQSKTRRAVHGRPPTICEEDIKPESGIYAVTDPVFDTDWSDHEVSPAYRYDRDVGELVDDQTVIGLTTDDGARAYPLTILNTHEVVNDQFGGPVLVTFCPICRSGMVASRRLEDDPTLFAVTGLLWQPERVFSVASEEDNRIFGASASGGEEVSVRHNGNLVMYDAATHTYWSQILASGICGPLTGTDLDIQPSSVASWGEWRERHSDTEVLLPPPHSETVEAGVILGETETVGR